MFAPIDNKKTKIVATIGPATESESQIEALIAAGMNVARFNTKHNQPEWHREVIRRVRAVGERMQVPVGILVDLQGPEIRITLKQPQFAVAKNEQLNFTSTEASTNQRDVLLPANVIQSLDVGNHILTDEGACHFVVVAKTDNQLVAECLDDCLLKTRKTLNTPNVVIDMPALLPEDEFLLEELKAENIEYVALSFVRTPQDIQHLRNVLAQKNLSADIIAKIENRKAIENLAEIIPVSDGVMVARGDLAMEVDFEELIFWQKKIIHLSQQSAKPVITATQMLLSMTQNPTPTRAEISDVANAVYDGTDAVMLSEETTVGKYPIKTVATQAKIARFYEQHAATHLPAQEEELPGSVLIKSAISDLNQYPESIEKIVIASDDLDLVRRLSSYRLKIPILVLSTSLHICQKMTLSYGIQPLYIPNLDIANVKTDELINLLKNQQKLSLGEKLLFIYNLNGTEESTPAQPILREVI